MCNEIHVVINRLDLSDSQNQHAGATIASVLEHCSKQVVFHIIHDGDKSFKNMESTKNNIEKYTRLVERYNSNVEFLDSQNIVWDERLPRSIIEKWSSVSLSRLHLQTIFPNIDHIILLGADVIVQTDLSKIIDIFSQNVSICGIYDAGIPYCSTSLKRKLMKNGINTDKYINADVLVFNLEKIRRDNQLLEKSIAYLNKFPDTPMFEQDVLNVTLENDCHLLPNQYNIMPHICNNDDKYKNQSYNYVLKRDYILHFAGPKKPWKTTLNSLYVIYWYYLSQTPWCNDK